MLRSWFSRGKLELECHRIERTLQYTQQSKAHFNLFYVIIMNNVAIVAVNELGSA